MLAFSITSGDHPDPLLDRCGAVRHDPVVGGLDFALLNALGLLGRRIRAAAESPADEIGEVLPLRADAFGLTKASRQGDPGVTLLL